MKPIPGLAPANFEKKLVKFCMVFHAFLRIQRRGGKNQPSCEDTFDWMIGPPRAVFLPNGGPPPLGENAARGGPIIKKY